MISATSAVGTCYIRRRRLLPGRLLLLPHGLRPLLHVGAAAATIGGRFCYKGCRWLLHAAPASATRAAAAATWTTTSATCRSSGCYNTQRLLLQWTTSGGDLLQAVVTVSTTGRHRSARRFARLASKLHCGRRRLLQRGAAVLQGGSRGRRRCYKPGMAVLHARGRGATGVVGGAPDAGLCFCRRGEALLPARAALLQAKRGCNLVCEGPGSRGNFFDVIFFFPREHR